MKIQKLGLESNAGFNQIRSNFVVATPAEIQEVPCSRDIPTYLFLKCKDTTRQLSRELITANANIMLAVC